MKYILMGDFHGNKNLWQIVSETDDAYIVQRCNSKGFIYKALCFEVDGSSILHTNINIDFEYYGDDESIKSPLSEDEKWYAEHEKFMDCECFNCWMIEVPEEK